MRRHLKTTDSFPFQGTNEPRGTRKKSVFLSFPGTPNEQQNKESTERRVEACLGQINLPHSADAQLLLLLVGVGWGKKWWRHLEVPLVLPESSGMPAGAFLGGLSCKKTAM